MEYGMKFGILSMMILIICVQTLGDFAIHEGRKFAWHRWKSLSLFALGMTPLVLWQAMEVPVLLWDYVACILLPYLVNRWLFFDLFMNCWLEERLAYIGHTRFGARILRRLFPKQNPIGWLWIRFIAWIMFHISWIVEWWPGHYLLHL